MMNRDEVLNFMQEIVKEYNVTGSVLGFPSTEFQTSLYEANILAEYLKVVIHELQK